MTNVSEADRHHISPLNVVYALFDAWIKVINVTNHHHGSSFVFIISYS